MFYIDIRDGGFEEEDFPVDGEFSENIVATAELWDLQRPIKKKSQRPQAVFPVPSIHQAPSSLPLSEVKVNTYKQQLSRLPIILSMFYLTPPPST